MATRLENAYRGRRVLVTGHTGFKGSWLSLWLEQLGALVTGYALAPPTQPNHFGLLDLGMDSVLGNLNDEERLRETIARTAPEVVFHLAAQPIVIRSYENPVETFDTNLLGTARVLDACRTVEELRAVVVVTSDKCYENREWTYGYRENDPLGGHDPYSASKACAEILTASFRDSFFPGKGGSAAKIATARAGNVIGGGDWGEHRLVPDIMRAAAKSEPVKIRNPNSSRPWQHVLEPLSGYLALGAELLEGNPRVACAWNFGPGLDSNLTTEQLFERLQKSWSEIRCEIVPNPDAPHEAGLLMLDSAKAQRELNWRPVWDLDATLAATADWYRVFHEEGRATSLEQVRAYVDRAAELGIAWAR